jgi:hypothetical protein
VKQKLKKSKEKKVTKTSKVGKYSGLKPITTILLRMRRNRLLWFKFQMQPATLTDRVVPVGVKKRVKVVRRPKARRKGEPRTPPLQSPSLVEEEGSSNMHFLLDSDSENEDYSQQHIASRRKVFLDTATPVHFLQAKVSQKGTA